MRTTMLSTLAIVGTFLLPTSTLAYVDCGTTTVGCSPGYHRQCVVHCYYGTHNCFCRCRGACLPDPEPYTENWGHAEPPYDHLWEFRHGTGPRY